MLPESITKVTDHLMKFPSMGRRSSQKIALQLLDQSDLQFQELLQDLVKMKQEVTFCPICGFFSQNNLSCQICSDKLRLNHQICVVEKPTEVIAMEKSLIYRGRYHVLGRLISPLDNVFAQNTNIPSLIDRLKNSESDKIELVLFLQPSFNAEATTAYIREKISELELGEKVNITKLAQGLPSFYNIDTLDHETLAKAMEGRIKV
jgi:recombination protein RecR